MSNPSIFCPTLWDEFHFLRDEGEFETLLVGAADLNLTTPKLGMGKGSGSINAVRAAEKHAFCEYGLVKINNRWVSKLPISMSFRLNADRDLEFKMFRKNNPLLPEDAKALIICQMRLSLPFKAVLNSWVDPANAKLYRTLTSKQRLALHKSNMESIH